MKNSKNGISLIVLVITIIVIIILAAAVILTLNNNNPIAEANDARYASDTANMQAVFTNVVAKIMAANQAVVTIAENKNISASTPVTYTLTNPVDSNNATGTIVFGTTPATPAEKTWYTGKALPTYPGKTVLWGVDTEGNINLSINGTVYPKGSTFSFGS